MPTVTLTTAEWNVVLEMLDSNNAPFTTILADRIFGQLWGQEN